MAGEEGAQPGRERSGGTRMVLPSVTCVDPRGCTQGLLTPGAE